MLKLPRVSKPDAEWRKDRATAISAKGHARLKTLARESGMSMKAILDILIEQAEAEVDSSTKRKEHK